MNRLHLQYQRLYLPIAGEGGMRAHDAVRGDAVVAGATAEAEQGVRALVLALSAPADWSVLGPLWRAVQAELDLPAPGIAVDGQEALQLWFSLAEPVSRVDGLRFLQALQRRYLADVKPARVHLLTEAVQTPLRLPPVQTGPERWSAFVAADLAAVFAEEPALDFQPGTDAQAELLSRLESVTSAAFENALLLLSSSDSGLAENAVDQAQVERAGLGPATHHQDPRCFLQDVMNDRSVPLSLRIQAATALLSSGHGGS